MRNKPDDAHTVFSTFSHVGNYLINDHDYYYWYSILFYKHLPDWLQCIFSPYLKSVMHPPPPGNERERGLCHVQAEQLPLFFRLPVSEIVLPHNTALSTLDAKIHITIWSNIFKMKGNTDKRMPVTSRCKPWEAQLNLSFFPSHVNRSACTCYTVTLYLVHWLGKIIHVILNHFEWC